jgi:hypothetical protein
MSQSLLNGGESGGSGGAGAGGGGLLGGSLWNMISNSGNGFFNLLDSLQDVPVTLNHEDLERLPTFQYSEIPENIRSMNAANCCICLDDFQDSCQVRVLLCRHFFHTACIDRWLEQENVRCPVCRHDNRDSEGIGELETREPEEDIVRITGEESDEEMDLIQSILEENSCRDSDLGDETIDEMLESE